MKLKTALMTALLTLSTLTSASALSVLVNGTPLQSDVPPQIINNRTFVPVSAVADVTGAVVEWYPGPKTVVIKRGSNEVQIKIGETFGIKNGNKVDLDSPAQIVDGRTMVPLSFIASNLDIPVSYDSATKTVLIGENMTALQTMPQPAPAPQQPATLSAQTQYKVLRVIDGDTIEIDMNGKAEKVRLIGVNTPESVHPDESKNVPFGKVASDFTKAALEGKNIVLEYDVTPRDKYGRILAYVWIDGKMFNKILLENGMAEVKTYPPDVKYVEDFTRLQETARFSKVGIWADYDTVFAPSTPPQQVTPPQQTIQPAPATPSVTIDTAKEGVWIKGNKKSKIYHIPTGRDYDKVSPQNIVWFQTEADAQAAGYRRAKQ